MAKSLAQQVIDAALEQKQILATAESCTGGLLGAAITAVSGASKIYERGYITYSNAAKMDDLGVSRQCLEQFGAVSKQTAAEMALGTLRASRADIAIAITGIAGPGASPHKAEGHICFALAKIGIEITTYSVDFGALGRHAVRQRAVDYALNMLRDELKLNSAEILTC